MPAHSSASLVRLAGAAALLACAVPAGRPRNLAYATVAAAPPAPADLREAYGAAPGQVGELRLPPGTGRVPVVVFVHGGCWRAQFGLAHVANAAAALTREGWATWSVEYRRVGDAGGGWPATFVDVARAVDHLRTLAARHPRLDTTRVVLAGHSAGGQLVLWAASRRAGEMLDGVAVAEAPLRVAGVVALAAITDVAGYAAATGCGSAVRPLLGGSDSLVAARAPRIAPIARVPIGVPVQLLQGSADAIVPRAQGDAFTARAVAAGDRVTAITVDGAGHFDFVAPPSAAWPTVVRAVRTLVPR